MAFTLIRRDDIYIRLFRAALRNARFGAITITTPQGNSFRVAGQEPGPEVDMTFRDWGVIRTAIWRGDIGFGEAYIDERWTTTNLPDLMTYFCMNLDAVDVFSHGNRFSRSVFNLINAWRRNSRSGSRKNISAHYDVGNDFYQLWLDPTMTYSSALYQGNSAASLEQAQINKYQRIISKIKGTGRRVLEIGCGWGGFAEQAAKEGFEVTGLTLSREQLAFARQRMEQQALADKVELKLQDYRDEKGLYDHIVSIEMFEAVGESYWPAYFRTVKERLREGGRAVIQTIIIADDVFASYRRRSDFIRHYTFPGGLLPSMQRIGEEMSKAGLKCMDEFRFGQDYALTLQRWIEALDHRRSEILKLGYSDEFLRSWRFYISSCIGAFRSGRTNVVQLEVAHA